MKRTPATKKLARWEIEWVDVASLKPHPRNYRIHPDDEIEHLMQSIRDHNVYKNIVISKDDVILAGHGVVQAATKMGLKHLPVRRLPLHHDAPLALKVLAGDNEIGRLSEVDDRILSDLLRNIGNDIGLMGTGYDEMMLANLLLVTRPETEIPDIDAAAEWVGMPEYEATENPPRIIVLFRNEEDRIKFMKKIEAAVVNRKVRKVWSIWWPEQERNDMGTLRFDESGHSMEELPSES